MFETMPHAAKARSFDKNKKVTKHFILLGLVTYTYIET